jgi:gas vesicle protein
MKHQNKQNAEVLLGFVAGMSLGYAISLLLAPDSGSGTRERLKSTGLNLLDQVLGRLEGTLEKAHMDAVLDEQSQSTF